ncbi:type II toxin-antitoxin system prevent-host-death family antitoxin [Geminocystis sp. CENA526]|uniref:type II toxin-antitoxin system prevent-host-death family antitoxin n=1 Tax=Geminocystis sp. CENA526 TaxID=1355871 RepID=UPI003D6FEF36
MQYFSSNLIKNNISTILETVKKEPVVISQEQEEVAVILSIEEYQKIVSYNIQDFQDFCDRIRQKAEAKGLTESKLLEILADE